VGESRRLPNLHHVVLAIGSERLASTARLFTDLGFEFDEFDLDDVGLHVMLDWAGGMELVTPTAPSSDNRVQQFLDAHGDGVYTIALRVGDAASAEVIARRYGAVTNFRQHRDGDGWQLDEIETGVRGLPLTLLSTDLP
jgi:methylmalonyl-CoA/ethylmalonyl-CoA epimerase